MLALKRLITFATMNTSTRIGVIGGGSWGTAIVKLLSNNLNQVYWWVHKEESVEHIRKFHHNPRYLQSVEFDPGQLVVTNRLEEIVPHCDVLVMATPAAFLHSVFEKYSAENFKGKIIFSAIKGMVPEYNAIPATYFNEQLQVPYDKIGIICGPCHAEEVALRALELPHHWLQQYIRCTTHGRSAGLPVYPHHSFG
jgi:glycerol-3-phosphate dehydrogenase (NAD(P)+)